MNTEEVIKFYFSVDDLVPSAMVNHLINVILYLILDKRKNPGTIRTQIEIIIISTITMK